MTDTGEWDDLKNVDKNGRAGENSDGRVQFLGVFSEGCFIVV